MTEQELRAKVIAIAQSYIGCKESDGSHKKIIDLYNSHKPLARNYAVKYTDAWCATFASAVAIQAGLTTIIPTECGCKDYIALFKKIGSWQEDDAHIPSPGDYVFYDWQDGENYATTDNTGDPDHVGIVEKVVGNTITVIEGNYSDSVKRRTLAVNGRYIRGYGVPKYADFSEEDDDMDVKRFKELWSEMRKELQDNDSSKYSEEAREWATSTGLIAGNGKVPSGEPNYMWGDVLTREQFVTVLYRFAKLTGMI